MRTLLLRNALIVAGIPLVTIGVLSMFPGCYGLGLIIGLMGVTVQLIAIPLAKRDLRRLAHPSANALMYMGVERIPAPYEPGKFDTDVKVASVFMYLGIPAPFLALFAQRYPMEFSVPLFHFEACMVPDIGMMCGSLALAVIGGMAVVFWGRLEQAKVVVNEKSEKLRYLYRGFVEEAENNRKADGYLLQLRSWRTYAQQ